MSGANNRFKQRILWFVGGFSLTIVLLIMAGTGVAEAQRPPPATPPPSAQITLLDTNRMVSPNILQPGELMTYTVRVTVQGSLTASDVQVEIPLLGNEQFSGFDAKYSGFSLNDPQNITDTIRITKPSMGLKEDVTFYLYTIVPTDLNKAIFQKAIFAKWTDLNGYYNKPFNIVVAVNMPLGSQTPVPVGVPSPPPTTAPGSELPTSGPFAPQADPKQPNTDSQWYIQATKHYLANGFLNFWLKNGTVTKYGWPISEEFNENGMTVQYFERAVFEYHPDNAPAFQVLLRSLGNEMGKGEAPASVDTAPGEGAIYYSATGHWLDGRLVNAWNTQGGLLQFGYPIAEAKIENNRLTQWFERARFEVDLSKTYPLVEFAKVGREYAVAKSYLKS